MTNAWKRWLDLFNNKPTDELMSELSEEGSIMTSPKRWEELISLVDDKYGQTMGILAQFTEPSESYPDGTMSINIVYPFANIFPKLKGATKIWYNDIAAKAYGFEPM